MSQSILMMSRMVDNVYFSRKHSKRCQIMLYLSAVMKILHEEEVQI